VDELHVVLALEALLHDVHVQEAEEAAAEAEAQRLRGLRLVAQARIVQLQLGERVTQRLVAIGFHRIQTREHLRLDLLEAGQRLGGGIVGHRHGIADLGVLQVLDAGDHEADAARREALARDRFGREDADLLGQVQRTRGHELDAVLGLDGAVDHAHQHDHAHVVVEPGVDDEGLQRRVGIALGGRNAPNHRLQHVVDALARLGAGVLDLVDHALGRRRREVDLVQHRHHRHAELGGGVAVGHGLRFHALRRVDHQERALARRQRARHLVGEVHVAGCINQVQVVDAPVARLVLEGRGLRLDGDAALALQVHGVEDLGLHLARRQAPGALDQAVRERALAVVDVGDDGEVADVVH